MTLKLSLLFLALAAILSGCAPRYRCVGGYYDVICSGHRCWKEFACKEYAPAYPDSLPPPSFGTPAEQLPSRP
jgi:hypothetical protein